QTIYNYLSQKKTHESGTDTSSGASRKKRNATDELSLSHKLFEDVTIIAQPRAKPRLKRQVDAATTTATSVCGASCPIMFACTEWTDFVDGIITWSTSVDANGCMALTISCGEEAGVTPAATTEYRAPVLLAGSYDMWNVSMPITCQAGGQWLSAADSQSFTCARRRRHH
ncbi:hypothetical protein AAVH_18475, partial [Aphelenchoides avenae]